MKEVIKIKDIDELLKHHGVKGMRWGVRKKQVVTAVKSKIASVKKEAKERKDSREREAGWSKQLSKIDKMDKNQMRTISNRIRNENEFKRLSNDRRVSNSNDRKEYRTRAKLSDKDLQSKVETLRVKEQLKRNISDATSEQRARGKKMVAIAVPLIMQMADGKVNPDNLRKNVNNPDPLTKAIREQFEKNIDRKYGKF